MSDDLVLARAADFFSALAHDARLKAVVALRRRGPLTVGALVDVCGLEQTALSHQLRVLRTAGLVRTTRRGKHIEYALVDDHVGCIVDDALAHAAHVLADTDDVTTDRSTP
ncbi:MAG TPA: metalloregulator ArsR/SmtB family transcription factor [Myxococcota bacterium]